MERYIIEGPKEIGNVFGHSGQTLAAGRFAIVEDGEYADGGYGPSIASGTMVYKSRERAEEVLKSLA